MPNGAALRSGRKTRKWHISPMRAPINMASTKASQNPVPPPSPRVTVTGTFSQSVGRKSTHGNLICPFRRASSNVNTPYIAIAP